MMACSLYINIIESMIIYIYFSSYILSSYSKPLIRTCRLFSKWNKSYQSDNYLYKYLGFVNILLPSETEYSAKKSVQTLIIGLWKVVSSANDWLQGRGWKIRGIGDINWEENTIYRRNVMKFWWKMNHAQRLFFVLAILWTDDSRTKWPAGCT